ncbi:two-component system chemotaxis response regulator CheY [Novosphingobium sp. PhB165]|nr:two-component system chemotaxis response regulator CheY [Novosphingobium sp. PhB165]
MSKGVSVILEGLIKRTPAPARREDETPAPQAAAAAVPEAPSGRRGLIVDDSRVIRKVSRRILEALGYTVTEAENGEEALSKCMAAMPDLILLDWNMPLMGGLEFVTALRGMQGAHRPKVVFCTTNSENGDIRKGIEAGADEYVIKPFDHHTLHMKLQGIGAA